LLGVSGRGVTGRDSPAACAALDCAPYTAGRPAAGDLTARVMGQDVALPVLISPTGVQAVHPDGELAVARAAAARGTAMGLSSLGSRAIEEVVAACPNTLAQVYWAGSREAIAGRVERARRAGAAGLIVTLDWTWSH